MSGVWIGWAAGLRLSNDSGVSAALVAWMSVQAHCMPFSLHLVCITYIMGRVSKAQLERYGRAAFPTPWLCGLLCVRGHGRAAEYALCGRYAEEARGGAANDADGPLFA